MCISKYYEKSRKDELPSRIIEVFDLINLYYPQSGYLKTANRPKTKAQCSVTKKIDLVSIHKILPAGVSNWWELTPLQFAEYFEREILILRDLISNFIMKRLKLENFICL